MLMFSIGIKNAILVILIILIIHFAIKNILFDNKKIIQKSAPSQCPITKDTTKETFYDVNSAIPETGVQHAKCIQQSSNLESEKENLLKFVFGDDAPKDDKGLDSFFKDFSKQISQCEKPYISCAKKTDDHTTPLPSTCDPNIQELPLLPDMEKVDVCNNKRDIMIVNEYKNENPMNGGLLYAGISPFDGFDMSFSGVQILK
jgi:hypothetical protein